MTLSLNADRFDWPQWRGLDRTGRTTEADLLKEWPESGPEQLWVSRDAGLGYSGPAVVGNRLVTMGLRGEAEQLICLDVSHSIPDSNISNCPPTFESYFWPPSSTLQNPRQL